MLFLYSAFAFIPQNLTKKLWIFLQVVALDEIKGHFPQGTTFEDYWPAKGSIEPVSSRSGVTGGNWTQKPPGQPQSKPLASAAAVQMQPNGISSLNQLNSSQLTALNNAYRLPGVGQLTAQQMQQLQLSGLAAQGPMTPQQIQQLIRAGLITNQSLQQLGRGGQQQLFPGQVNAAQRPTVDMAQLARQQQQQAAAAARPAAGQTAAANKTFPGKLTQIKEFPMERSNQPPYKLQKALIDQKIVPCINVRLETKLLLLVNLTPSLGLNDELLSLYFLLC